MSVPFVCVLLCRLNLVSDLDIGVYACAGGVLDRSLADHTGVHTRDRLRFVCAGGLIKGLQSQPLEEQVCARATDGAIKEYMCTRVHCGFCVMIEYGLWEGFYL